MCFVLAASVIFLCYNIHADAARRVCRRSVEVAKALVLGRLTLAQAQHGTLYIYTRPQLVGVEVYSRAALRQARLPPEARALFGHCVRQFLGDESHQVLRQRSGAFRFNFGCLKGENCYI